MHQVKVGRETAWKESAGPIQLAFHFMQRRSPDSPGRSAASALAGRWRTRNLRARAVFHDEAPRRYEAGDLRIPKTFQQCEYVAIDRLLPKLLARRKVTAHQRRFDPRIKRGGVERQQAALPVSRDPDAFVTPALQPIHQREHFRKLIADDVIPHLVRLAVNPLAMRKVREAIQLGVSRERIAPVDQNRDEHLKTVL